MTQQYGSPQYGYPTPQQNGNGLAIAGMVCGIVGIFLFWIILSPLAIIFGSIGINKANHGARYKGQAIAGLVLGIISVVGHIILVVVVLNNPRLFY